GSLGALPMDEGCIEPAVRPRPTGSRHARLAVRRYSHNRRARDLFAASLSASCRTLVDPYGRFIVVERVTVNGNERSILSVDVLEMQGNTVRLDDVDDDVRAALDLDELCGGAAIRHGAVEGGYRRVAGPCADQRIAWLISLGRFGGGERRARQHDCCYHRHRHRPHELQPLPALETSSTLH